MKKISVALIGYGYWGPILLKNSLIHPKVEVKFICDSSSKQLNIAKIHNPDIPLVKDFNKIVNVKSIDCAIIAVPVLQHFKIARAFITSGKNVLIEKPMTETATEAEELINLASQNNVVICVDHPYVVSEAVKKIKSLLDKNYFGNLYYYKSERANLGRIDKAINVFTDLLPHDLAILDYLLDKQEPEKVIATGSFHILNKHIEDGTVFLKYKNGFVANIHVSWLSPIKIRHITIAGNKRMLEYNDEYTYDKLQIFNSGVNVSHSPQKSKLLIKYRQGKIITPKINNIEQPVYKILDHFVQAVLYKKPAPNDSTLGLRVVKVLENINKSLQISTLS